MKTKESQSMSVAGICSLVIGILTALSLWPVLILPIHELRIADARIPLVLGLVGLAFAAAALMNRTRRRMAIPGLAVNGCAVLVLSIFLVVDLLGAAFLSAQRGWEVVRLISASKEPHVYPDVNLRLAALEAPWTEVDVKKFNPDAMLGYMRSKPSMAFFVIAEKAGVETGIELAALVEAVRANLKGAAKDVEQISEVEMIQDGVTGTYLQMDARVGHNNLRYHYWIAIHLGACYQLIVCGPRNAAALLEKEARKIFSGFSLNDREYVVHAEGVEPVGNYRSEELGVSIDLTGTEWYRDLETTKAFPEAHLVAWYRRIASFVVVPFPLQIHKPDSSSLISALVATIDLTYPGGDFSAPRKVQVGAAEGYELTTRGEWEDGTIVHYRLQVLRNDQFAYLLAGWIDESFKEENGVLEDLFGLVRIEKPSAPLEVSKWTEGQKSGQAGILAHLGLEAIDDRQYERASSYYRRAFELKPKDPDLLAQVLRALSALERYEEAHTTLEKHRSRFPDNQLLLSWRAFLQKSRGRTEEALDIYRGLFDSGYEGEDDLLDYVNLLVDGARYDEGIRALESYLAQKPSSRVRRWLAQMHSRKGDHAGSAAILEAMLRDMPFDRQVAYTLGTVYEEMEDHNKVLSICKDLIERGHDGPDTYELQGRNQLSLQWYRMAKSSFEKAAEKTPNDAEIKDYLRVLSGYLGEGDNSSIKVPVEPVAIPPTIRKVLDDALAKPEKIDDQHGAQFSTRVTGIEFQRGKELKTTYYHRVRVNTLAGVKSLSTLEFTFDPLDERIYVNHLRVMNAAGKLVSTGEVKNYYVVDDSSSGVATHDKKLHMPVPGLKAGHLIEYAVTTEKLGRRDEFELTTHSFSAGYPVRCGVFFVRGEVDALRSEESLDLKATKEDGLIYWSCVDSPVYKWEPLQPAYETFLPVVWIGDRSLSWEGLARKYLEGIADTIVPDPSADALAKELIKGLESPAERVAALARYVQENLTYKAIEFGRRAMTPRLGREIIQNKYGDCKDHSLLLHQLLRAAGLKSHLALVRVGQPIREEIPSLDWFDHMIVYLPKGTEDGKRRFIDATSKNCDLLAQIYVGLNGMKALVLDAGRPHLSGIPDYPPNSRSFSSLRRVRFDTTSKDEGRLDTAVEEVLTLGGIYAAGMRGYLRGMDPGKRKPSISELMRPYGKVKVEELDVKHLDQTAKPLVLELRYDVEDIFQVEDGQLVGTLPWIWEQDYGKIATVEDRQSPFIIHSPETIETTLVITAAEGYFLPSLEWTQQEGESEFMKWESRGRQDGQDLHLTRRVQTFSGRYPASRFQEYSRVVDRASALLSRTVILKKSR